MFGAKPFGTPFASGTNTFGTSTPFGTAAGGFGTPAFGSNTPAPTAGIFGQNTTTSTATALFGGGQQTRTFGGGQNTGFAFGSTPSTSGGLFGQNNQSTGAGLFATPVNNTAFGAKTPGFSGFGATGNAASTSGALFGAQSSGSSLFGQSSGTFGTSTPQGTAAGGFGTPAFGSNTQAPTGGLFGQNTTTSTATGLSGGGQQTSTFGGGQNTGFAFGSTPSTSGGLFGQNNKPTGVGLFATPVSNTAFGAKTPGFSASTGGALFGAQSSGSSLFGQSTGHVLDRSLMGSKSGKSHVKMNRQSLNQKGFAQKPTSGTTFKFNPPNGQDTIVKNGVTTNINTKHQCITAMKEYENKSIEELRLEDYVANRKGKQQQASGTLFGTTPATQATGFNFGSAFSGTGFGTSVGFGTLTGTSLFSQQQQQSTSLFGQQNKTVFGTTTTANTGLGFGTSNSTGTSLFGQQLKLGGLFGTNSDTTQSRLFGVGTGTSFGSTSTIQPTAFGTSQQQSTGLFAQKLPAFGTSTTGSRGFNAAFGSTPSTSGGLFGQNNQSTGAGLFATPTISTAFDGKKKPGFSGFTPSGTTIKFNPPNGQDTIVKNGVTTNINTKHQCITAMKEYENRSIEELRLEYYVANRKGKQQQASGTLSGTTLATQATGFSFGGTGSGIGTSDGFAISTRTLAFGQQQQLSTNLFGQQKKLSFGTTTTILGFQYGTSANTVTSLFGEQQKLGGPFGTNPATTQSSLFGATGFPFGGSSTFQPTAFGTSQQQSTGLFGQKPPFFRTSTTGSIGLKVGGQEISNPIAKTLANTFSSSSMATISTVGFGFGTTSIPLISITPAGSWRCDVCITQNMAEANKCATCFGTTSTPLISITPPGSWKCDVCLTQNKADANKCATCESAKPVKPTENRANAASSTAEHLGSPTQAAFQTPASQNVTPVPTWEAPKDISSQSNNSNSDIETITGTLNALNISACIPQQIKESENGISQRTPPFSFKFQQKKTQSSEIDNIENEKLGDTFLKVPPSLLQQTNTSLTTESEINSGRSSTCSSLNSMQINGFLLADNQTTVNNGPVHVTTGTTTDGAKTSETKRSLMNPRIKKAVRKIRR